MSAIFAGTIATSDTVKLVLGRASSAFGVSAAALPSVDVAGCEVDAADVRGAVLDIDEPPHADRASASVADEAKRTRDEKTSILDLLG
jgi:hypothetical protein